MDVAARARVVGGWLRGPRARRAGAVVLLGAVGGAVAAQVLMLDVSLNVGAWGALVGAGMGVVTVVRGGLVSRWGAWTSWAVVALSAGVLAGSWLWLLPACYADVGLCARGSMSWALVGVLCVLWTALLVAMGRVVWVSMRSLVRWWRGRRA